MSKASAISKKRVLILDDHVILRQGIRALMKNEPDLEVCGEAASLEEAMAEVEEKNPDLVIVDISLGSQSGLEFIKQMKTSNPDVKTLVLSAHDEENYAERAIRAGASGYLMKDSSAEDLLQAIRKSLEGQFVLSKRVTQNIVTRLRGIGKVQLESPADVLSDRELVVFELIGRGQRRSQIAVTLDISPKTVQAYQEHIKRKLGIKSAVELHQRAFEWVQEQV